MQKTRIDKWLWRARFFKTRTLANNFIRKGFLRLNSKKIVKSSARVAIGDILVFAKGSQIKIIKIEELGVKRGSASDARNLYLDFSETGIK